MKGVWMLRIQQVVEAFRYAVKKYGCEKADYVGQTDLKAVTVLAVDALVPLVAKVPRKQLYLCANNMDGDRDRKWAVDHLLHTEHYENECLVDVNVAIGRKDPYRTIITAESEGWPGWVNFLNAKNPTENDLMWDLYKLIQVPSPLRFFVTLSAKQHHDKLLEHTDDLIAKYARIDGGRLLSGSTLFAVQFPTAKLSTAKVRFQQWRNGRCGNSSPLDAEIVGRWTD
jgi:hypothetical protein